MEDKFLLFMYFKKGLDLANSDINQSNLMLQEALRLAEKTNEIDAIIDICELMAVNYSKKNQIIEQRNFLQKSISYCIKKGNFDKALNLYIIIALTYSLEFDDLKSKEFLEKALLYIDKAKDASKLSLYLRFGAVNNNLYLYDEAEKYLERALPLALSLRKDRELADCYFQYAIVYKENFDFLKSKECFEKALKMNKDFGNLAVEIECLNNLGLVHLNLYEYQMAEQLFEESIRLAGKTKNEVSRKFAISAAYVNLGLVHLYNGEYQDALVCYQTALGYKTEINDKKGMAICYGNMALVFHMISKIDDALEYGNQALVLAKEIGNRSMELMTNLVLADLNTELDNYSGALVIMQKIDDGLLNQNIRAKMMFYMTYGKILLRLKPNEETIKYFTLSSNLAKEIGDKRNHILSVFLIGLCNLDLKYYNEAINYFTVSLGLAKEIGDKILENTISGYLGILHHEIKSYKLSCYFLKEAITIEEIIGENIIDNELKIGHYGRAAPLYEFLIEGLIKSNRQIEAYEYAMKSKSKAFLDLLASSKFTFRTSNPIISNLIEEEEKLLMRKRIIQNRYLYQKSTYSKIFPTYEELKLINSRLIAIYNEIGIHNQEYVSLRKTESMDIGHLQKLIKNEEIIIVDYFISRFKIFIFTVSSKDFEVEIVPFDETQFNEFINNYEQEVVNFMDFNVAEKDLTNLWMGLERYLIRPIAKYLATKKIIYFVPHKRLHHFPLHALKLHDNYLITNHAISYLFSPILLKFYNYPRSQPSTCYAIGIKEDDSFFDREIRNIANIYNTTAISEIPKSELKKYLEGDIIHFATHGSYDSNNPLLSNIKLNQNEYLTVEEIFHLSIKSDLVTVSSCESGLNKYYSGDELVGFTRAFIYAGAKSVIVSLWKVYDPTSYEIMTSFYRELNGGSPKVFALQKTQTRLLNEKKYSHPYYWAPFVLFGNYE